MQLLVVLAPAILTLATGAMLLAYLAGHRLAMGMPRALTLAIETGIQNAGTGLVITAVVLQNTDMSAAVLLYGILMQVPALGLIIWRNLPGHSGQAQLCGAALSRGMFSVFAEQCFTCAGGEKVLAVSRICTRVIRSGVFTEA